MVTTTNPTGAAIHNHVERVSPNEWEDEAVTSELGDALADGQKNGQEQPKHGMNLRSAAAALRSSFTAMRRSSASGSPKASPSGRRDSVMGSLLHGLASAVGLHPRDSSPDRDVSPGPDPSSTRSKRSGSHPHTLARLSSAAMMRAELQNLSQFGDLRNDSFTVPSCSKLRRRSSQMLPLPSEGSATGPSSGTITQPTASDDLIRHSAHAAVPPSSACTRLNCPSVVSSPGAAPPPGTSPTVATAAATALALGTSPPRESSKLVASPFYTAAAAAAGAGVPPPGDAAPGGNAAPGAAAASGGGGGLRVRRSSGGGPQLQGLLVVEIPSPSAAPLPPPPSNPPPQTRPSGGSLSPPASRSVSVEHLPPMMPGGGGGLLSARDRPPTPRGGRTPSSNSPPSTLAKVLGSFHLPDILTSGRSVTERRSSMAGGGSVASFTRPPDVGLPRSRRNSICSGPSVTGPGGAAISASIAKRAAAAAAAAAAPQDGGGVGGGSCLPSPVAPSGASWTCQMRSSAPSGAARAGSMVGKPPAPQGGGILMEFHNSLELDEDKALAAVDAEFDRRFGQPPTEVPGAVDGGSPNLPAPQQPRLSPPATSSQHPTPSHTHLQPLNLPQLPQQSQSPPHQLPSPLLQSPPPPPQQQQQQPGEQLVPRAPASERTTPQSLVRRAYAVGDGNGRSCGAPAAGPGASASACGGGGGGGPPIAHALRRMSCSTLTLDGVDDVCADHVLGASVDVMSSFERNSNRMRLASIRLSYAEGIVGGSATASSGRTSLDPPPAALTRGYPAACTAAQSSGALAVPSPPIGRQLAPPSPITVLTAAGVAAV